MIPNSGHPDTCTTCPHLDEFHGACSHEYRQAIVQHFGSGGTECPLYRSDAVDVADEADDSRATDAE